MNSPLKINIIKTNPLCQWADWTTLSQSQSYVPSTVNGTMHVDFSRNRVSSSSQGPFRQVICLLYIFQSEGTLYCASEASKKPMLSIAQFSILKHFPENNDFSFPKQLSLLFPYCWNIYRNCGGFGEQESTWGALAGTARTLPLQFSESSVQPWLVTPHSLPFPVLHASRLSCALQPCFFRCYLGQTLNFSPAVHLYVPGAKPAHSCLTSFMQVQKSQTLLRSSYVFSLHPTSACLLWSLCLIMTGKSPSGSRGHIICSKEELHLESLMQPLFELPH